MYIHIYAYTNINIHKHIHELYTYKHTQHIAHIKHIYTQICIYTHTQIYTYIIYAYTCICSARAPHMLDKCALSLSCTLQALKYCFQLWMTWLILKKSLLLQSTGTNIKRGRKDSKKDRKMFRCTAKRCLWTWHKCSLTNLLQLQLSAQSHTVSGPFVLGGRRAHKVLPPQELLAVSGCCRRRNHFPQPCNQSSWAV